MSDFVPVFVEIRGYLTAHSFTHTAHVSINAADMAVVQISSSIVRHPVKAVTPGTVEGKPRHQSDQVGSSACAAGYRVGRCPTENEAGLTAPAKVALVFVNGHSSVILA